MTDSILTILGLSMYIPFFVQLARTRWDRTKWPRQLLLLSMSLELTSLLHVPPVMYCGIGLMGIALIIYIFVMRPAFRWTPFFIVCSLYVATFAVSLIWSPLPQKGIRMLTDCGLPILGIATLSGFLQIEKEELFGWLKVFSYAALGFVGLAFVAWLISCTELHVAPWDWPIENITKPRLMEIENYRWIFRFNGGIDGYTHPSYNLLVLFAGVCSAMRLGKERILHPSIGWILWTGGFGLTILTQSRMSIIYSMIILIAALIYAMPTLRKRMITAGTIVLIGAGVLWSTKAQWQTLGQDETRDLLYSYTWRYIHAKPWTGAGAGALNPVEMCHTIGETFWPNVGIIDPDKDIADWPWKTRMLPHNQWLADWAHAGIAAAIVALLLYLCVGVECIRKRSYWGGIMLLIFTIFSCLEPPLYIGKGFYLFFLMSMSLFALQPDRER